MLMLGCSDGLIFYQKTNEMIDDDGISLRPLSLRPVNSLGGGNPFSGFAKGSGQGLKNKQVRLG